MSNVAPADSQAPPAGADAPRKRARARTVLLGALATAALLYAATAALLATQLPDIVYRPSGSALAPAEAGFAGAERLRIRTLDGETLAAWFKPAAEGRGLLLNFHGAAGSLALRAPRFAAMTQRGEGLLAVEYRGYPGSTGPPSEEGLLRDADAALSEAVSRGYEPSRVVFVGEDLGAAVAIALAAKRPVAGLALESAFLSMRDHLSRQFPWAPIGLILTDPWRSDQRIPRVRAPLLQIHGLNDEMIPLEADQRLHALAREPKTWRVAALSGHQALEEATPQFLDFVESRVAAR